MTSPVVPEDTDGAEMSHAWMRATRALLDAKARQAKRLAETEDQKQIAASLARSSD